MGWSFYNSDGQILQGVLAGATLTIPVITEIDSGSTITLDATTDIVLDAGGADILLKDDGTDFGGFTNTSGNLIIKSGTTTAMTFSGANATLAGNLTVSGTTTTVDSTTLTVVDPIIHLQTATGGGALSGDTNKDVGIAMQYHNGSAAKTAFLGFDDSDSKLMYIADATLSSEVISNPTALGTIKANIEAATIDVSGDLTLSAGADGALRFSVASSVKILDNSAASLVFEEADNAYMTFVTTNSSEAVKFDKALDLNAAVQLDSTMTVGVDNTGYDVKFFGATASAYMLWDEDVDDLILAGAARIVIPDGQLVLGSTAVSSTAAEINLLDALDRGSILYGNASGVTTVLGQGGADTVLTSDGDDIAWQAAAAGVGLGMVIALS